MIVIIVLTVINLDFVKIVNNANYAKSVIM